MDTATKPEASGLHSALRYKFMRLWEMRIFGGGACGSCRRAQPKLVIDPGTESDLAEVLRPSNDAGLAVISTGGGTKLGVGNPPARAI